MRLRPRRAGVTLIELIAVLAVLILLAVIVSPSMDAMYGGTRLQGAADQLRGELAAARAWAMDDGVPYRVAVSDDGTKVRRAPEAEFDQTSAESQFSTTARRVEYALDDQIVARVQPGTAGERPPSDGTWTTVAVLLPDGTCRADRGSNPTFAVALMMSSEGKSGAGLQVTIRALTGETRIVPFKPGGQ